MVKSPFYKKKKKHLRGKQAACIKPKIPTNFSSLFLPLLTVTLKTKDGLMQQNTRSLGLRLIDAQIFENIGTRSLILGSLLSS